MSDVGGEIAENCGFQGKILCEVPQPCAPCDSGDNQADYALPEGCQNDGGWSSGVNGTEPVPQPEPKPEPQPEPQPEPVKVREGRWKTRGGDIRNVTPTPAGDGRDHRFPWWDAQYRQTWAEDGRYHFCGESPFDLVKCLGPIEPQPEPQPPMLQDADQMIRLLSEANHNHVAMIGRLQARIHGLEIMTDTQAETIARLQSEAHELNMEIGGLQRISDLETMHAAATQAVVDAGKENDKLRAQADDFRSEIHYVQKELGEARAELAGAIQSRDALAAVNREIRRNETLREQLDAAAADLQKRHPDHVGRAISTEEWMDQFARDTSVSRLQADRNDLAGKVISLREQLQQANDRLAFLETLQPIAAACHTAQTMVRDMLGHMRCLLALQHTTDRRDSCTLLESILEVFDDAECDEDEDEDTTNTSEAGQG